MTEAAAALGYSRPTYYQAASALESSARGDSGIFPSPRDGKIPLCSGRPSSGGLPTRSVCVQLWDALFESYPAR